MPTSEALIQAPGIMKVGSTAAATRQDCIPWRVRRLFEMNPADVRVARFMANESSYLAARLGLSARRVCHAGEAHCRAGIEQPYLHPAVAPILDQRTGHCSLP